MNLQYVYTQIELYYGGGLFADQIRGRLKRYDYAVRIANKIEEEKQVSA